MKYICLFLFACISIISKAQTLILSENDSTVMTEYNDGNLWAYRNANGFIVGLTTYETKDDYGKYYRIDVFIKNQCDSSVIFTPDDVTSHLLTNRGDNYLAFLLGLVQEVPDILHLIPHRIHQMVPLIQQ